MTDAERRHPNTLIDRLARERIGQDAGATPEEVERLVRVFESWRRPSTRAADKKGTSEGNPTELAVWDGPKKDDLLALPVRACVAFAVRCALRVNNVIESLDEETIRAAQRAIGIAADYAGGKDCDLRSLEEAENAVRLAALLLQLEGAGDVDLDGAGRHRPELDEDLGCQEQFLAASQKSFDRPHGRRMLNGRRSGGS